MAGIDLSGVARLIEDMILLDTVRVTDRGTGERAFNPTTGEYEYPDPAVVYEGPGAVLGAGPVGGEEKIPVATQPWVDQARSRYQLLTPLDAPVPQRDHTVQVIAVHTGGDAALLGRSWRCEDPARAGTLVAVRATPLTQTQQTTGGG